MSNVQACRTEPYNRHLHAFALNRRVPERVDWVAQKDVTKYAPGTTRDDYAQHSIASAAEVACWKDTNILNEYGNFDHGKSEVINPHASPEHLCSKSALSTRKLSSRTKREIPASSLFPTLIALLTVTARIRSDSIAEQEATSSLVITFSRVVERSP